MMNGSAAGTMILPKICASLAPSACATSTSARLTFLTPPYVFTMIGKNAAASQYCLGLDAIKVVRLSP